MIFIFIILISTNYSWGISSSDSFEEPEFYKISTTTLHQSAPQLIPNNTEPLKLENGTQSKSETSLNRRLIRKFSTIFTKKSPQDFPIKKEYTQEELCLINADPTSSLFLDSTKPHGLNIPNIHERCFLIREVKGNGKDFSNLVVMLERSATLLSEKEETLKRLEKKRNPTAEDFQEISLLCGVIPSYEVSIQRALETISQNMMIEEEQLKSLLIRERKWIQKAKEKFKI